MEPHGGADNKGTATHRRSTTTTSGEHTKTDNNIKVKEEPREHPQPKSADGAPDVQGFALTDFAETTMNELLGWYGYEKVVHREDTQGLNLQRFTGRESSPSGGSGEHGATTTTVSTTKGGGRPHTPTDPHRDSVSDGSCDSDLRASSAPSPGSGSEIAAQHQTLVTALTSSKSPNSSRSPDSPTSSEAAAVAAAAEATTRPGGYIACAWCQKVGLKQFTLKTDTGTKVFCSELCFTQCRRASFKKNKVCDWCKHVRHTVNYVDFQDGEQQLQFCSDKCLNQYKMNIFCKETQEHLQLIHAPSPGGVGGNGGAGGGSTGGQPLGGSADEGSSSATPSSERLKHHRGSSGSGGRGGGDHNQILITPDLWLQNNGEGSGRRKRRRRESSSDDMDYVLLDDERSREDSDESPTLAIEPPLEVKPDISKMNLKTENAPHPTPPPHVLSIREPQSKVVSDLHRSGSVEMPRRGVKIDHHSARERIRRVRSRDSTCTPLAVTTSPASSAMSTPPSVSAGLTPPSSVQAPPPGPPGMPPHHLTMMGTLPPGMMAPPQYFYPHMVGAAGFPGMPPHWMGMIPPGMPGGPPVPPPLGLDTTGRQISPTPAEGSHNGPPSGSSAAVTSGSGSAASYTNATTNTTTLPPASCSSTTATSSGKQPQPIPGMPPPPGMPYPMGHGIPPGFPVPFPPGMHPAMVPPPHPTLPGGPPITIMVPYPVMVPVPVPIPIPVPIRCDKDLRDLALIMKSTTAMPASATSSRGRPSCSTRHGPCTAARPASVPLKSASSPPAAVVCAEQRRCHTDDEKENSESAANCDAKTGSSVSKYKIACACCQQSTPGDQLRQPTPTSAASSPSDPHCHKSMANGRMMMTMADLGLRRVTRGLTSDPGALDAHHALVPQNGGPDDDVAIDLSKDRSKSSFPMGGSSSERHTPHSRTPPATITVKSEAPPLIISPLGPSGGGTPAGGFLMPPRDHAYSSRRSMILDAPSVPRDRGSGAESPSPEKRLMLRSPNRDVMFAKRRCMRTRIKTK